MILRGLAISITASRPFTICATRKQAKCRGPDQPGYGTVFDFKNSSMETRFVIKSWPFGTSRKSNRSDRRGF